METPKIVTGLVILSMALAGCRAQFTSVNGPENQPQTAATGPGVDPFTAPTAPIEPTEPNIPVRTPPPPITPNICETSEDTTLDGERMVVYRTVTFYRGRQMVWRKNCEGKVVSKTYENIGDVTSKTVSIEHPGANSWSVTNRTTCSNMGYTKILKKGNAVSLRLPVSLKASRHALQVKPGRNFIDFEVDEKSGSQTRGTLILTVKVKNSTDDCIVIKPRNCPAQSKESTTPWMSPYG